MAATQVAAMCSTGDPAALGRACDALRVCACPSVEDQVVVAAAGGIEAIITTMISFPSNEDLQYRACWALHCITLGSADIWTRAVEAGAITALSAALCNHPACPAVLRWGTAALDSMAMERVAGAAEGETAGRGVGVGEVGDGGMDALVTALQARAAAAAVLPVTPAHAAALLAAIAPAWADMPRVWPRACVRHW